MMSTNGWIPQARTEGLIVHELADEILVYDLERHRAHSLNPVAALVWRQCDGRMSVTELAARLEREHREFTGEEVVWLALERLSRARLLESQLPQRHGVQNASRRALVKSLAMAGGMALVTSIVAPVAEAAVSNLPSCTTMHICSNGHCCRCNDNPNGNGSCVGDCGNGQGGNNCRNICKNRGGVFACN